MIYTVEHAFAFFTHSIQFSTHKVLLAALCKGVDSFTIRELQVVYATPLWKENEKNALELVSKLVYSVFHEAMIMNE